MFVSNTYKTKYKFCTFVMQENIDHYEKKFHPLILGNPLSNCTAALI